MSSNQENLNHHQSWPTRSLILVVLVFLLLAIVTILLTAPFAAILGPGTYALAGAAHGLFAFFLLIVSTIALYLAFRLFTNRIKAFPDLQLISTVISVLSFIAICFGNWIYIPYRAATSNSPKAYFLANMPEVHRVFFEFKEYIALFTLPLSVAAAFILWRYGKELLERRDLRNLVSLLLLLHFICFTIAFGLGAAVTKLRPI